jgi:GTP-binding protein
VSLGLGEPFAVTALHGLGTGDLLDELVKLFPVIEPVEEDEVVEGPAIPGVAIVGRPNVGKSTLFNRLIGDERAVVHDMPGTTRDAIDTVVETDEGPIRFIDTAGMRRRSKVDDGTEYYSVVRALRAVDDADIALLVIDATEGVTHQDQRLAERVDASGCPIVVLLNKFELLDTEQRLDIARQVEDRLHFIGNSTVLRISAKSGKGLHKLLPVLALAIEDYHRRVPTREVNKAIQAAQSAQPAPGGARVLYATQGAADPPTFTLFVNRELPPTYLRYLEGRLREDLDLGSTPVKLRVRRRS